jgi:hypothetical protein
MKKMILLIFLIGMVVLSSCNQTTTPANGDQSSSWKVPEPDATTGVVMGRLVGTGGKVEISGTPFLSENLTAGQSDIPPTISFSISKDPRAMVNETTGEFYFSNITPEDYYVITILFGPGEMYIVREKNSEDPLSIVVEAGKTLDLGDVIVKVNNQ